MSKLNLIVKRLLGIAGLFLVPHLCHAQGQEKALGGFIAIILAIIFLLTCFSVYQLILFRKDRKLRRKILAILVSVLLSFIATLIILLSDPHPDNAQDPYSQQDSKKQKSIGYLILVPNLVVLSVSLFIRAKRQQVFKK